MTTTPEVPRLAFAAKAAAILLMDIRADTFPIDASRLIHDNRWGTKTYRQMAQEYACTIQGVADLLRSDDGVALYLGGQYCIAYNEDSHPDRVRFTVVHEIGHIVLGHLAECKQASIHAGGLPPKLYQRYEKEADTFARNFLAPPAAIAMREGLSRQSVGWLCGISKTAAAMRAQHLRMDCGLLSDEGLYSTQHAQFTSYMLLRRCATCGAANVVGGMANFCPICGGDSFEHDGCGTEYPDPFSVNADGRARACPRCGKRSPAGGAPHCDACGTFLINRCIRDAGPDACGAPLPAHARFCPRCGAQSTFYAQKLLPSWQSVPLSCT